MQRRNPLINSGWLCLLTSVMISSLSPNAQAQVVPDATLGNGNNSVTSTMGDRTDITGGLQRNSSLFHSFEQFNVNTNKQVYFANPTDIRNIFSRVTGGNLSNIDGTLGVAGSANLFFINPNGIIFGPNARLDIPGSFFASTADALTFTDGQKFAATGDRAVPLVEVNIPLGLQMGANSPAMLTNQGQLAVGAGQSLTLAGGITTSTGSLTSSGGTVQVLGNQVSLQDQAQIDVSRSTGGGTVLVGGDYQGKGSLLNATQTSVGKGVTINANATTKGNGGKVIVWSDDTTQFNGTINARGGSQGGNGGFVEVSGRQNLGVQGQVRMGALQGQPGQLLLDPQNITIEKGGTDPIPAPDPDDTKEYKIDPASIQTALGEGLVILQANDSITVIDPIVWNSNNNLYFFAGTSGLNGTVNLNAPITIPKVASTNPGTGRLIGGNGTANSNFIGTVDISNSGVKETSALIQNGIDIAASGATIKVAAGSYSDKSVSIDKPLNLAFAGTTPDTPVNLGEGSLLTATSSSSTPISLSGNLTTKGDVVFKPEGTGSFNTATLKLAASKLDIQNESSDPLQLAGSFKTGGLTITSTSGITSNSDLNLDVSGTTTLDAGNNQINLLNAKNNLNTVEIKNASSINLKNNSSALNLKTIKASGDININTSGTLNINESIKTDKSQTITLQGFNVIAKLGEKNSISTPSGTVNFVANGNISLISGKINVAGSNNSKGGNVQIGGSLNAGYLSSKASKLIESSSSKFTIDVSGSGSGIPGSVTIYTKQALPTFNDGSNVGIDILPDTPEVIKSSELRSQDGNLSGDLTFTNITITNGSVSTTPNGFTFTDYYIDNSNALADILYMTENFVEDVLPISGFTALVAKNTFIIEDLADNNLNLSSMSELSSISKLAAGKIFLMRDSAEDVISHIGGNFEILAGDITAQPPQPASLTIGGVKTGGGSLTIKSSGSASLGTINTSPSRLGLGGDVGLTSLGNMDVGGNGITTTGGKITADSGGELKISGNLNTSLNYVPPNDQVTPGGEVSLTSAKTTELMGANINTGGGKITADSGDNLTISGNLNTALDYSTAGGEINLTSAKITSLTGSIITTGGGKITADSGDELKISSSLNTYLNDTNPGGEASLTSVKTTELTGANINTGGGKITADSGDKLKLIDSYVNTSLSQTKSAGSIILTSANDVTLTNSDLFSEGNGTDFNQIWIESITGSTDLSDTNISAANPKGSIGSGLAGDILVNANSEVRITNSSISTAGNQGRISVGSSDLGSIDLTPENDPVPQKVMITNSELTTTNANIEGNKDSGSIQVRAGQVTVETNSKIIADTVSSGEAGKIEVQAIAADPDTTIAALTIDNSQVEVSTSGKGKAGTISLAANLGDIALKNASKVASNTQAAGSSGTVDLKGQNLSITGGSVVQARSKSTGAPGNIQIDVPNKILVSGISPTGQISEISTFSGEQANLSPNAVDGTSPGSIRINQPEQQTATLTLSERGRINASTQSTNSAYTGGSVTVNANNLNINSGGQILTSSGGAAKAGGITINVRDRIDVSGAKSSLAQDPEFQDAVNANVRFKILGGANFSTNSGLITSGNTPAPLTDLVSFVGLSGAEQSSLGDAVNGSALQITFNSNKPIGFDWKFLTNESIGNESNTYNDLSFLKIDNTFLKLADTKSGNQLSAQLNPFTDSTVPGFYNETVSPPDKEPGSPDLSLDVLDAEEHKITFGVVNVGDGSVASGLQLQNVKLGGKSIKVLVDSSDIDFKKDFISGIFAQADGSGGAGNITVNTANLSLKDQGAISASTETGTAGDILIDGGGTGQVTLSNGAQISGSTVGGKGGKIELNGLNTLQATNSLIEASTTKNGGSAGAITVNAAQSVTLDGVLPPGITDSTGGISTQASDGSGSAGAITVNTSQLKVQNGAAIAASTDSGEGDNIILSGLNTLQLNNGTISASTQTGAAGSVTITANQGSDPSVQLLNNSKVEATAEKAGGQAGGVAVTAPTLTVTGAKITTSNSDFVSNGTKEGNITLQELNTLVVNGGSQITASTKTGKAGAVFLNPGKTAAQSVELTGKDTVLAAQAEVEGGNAGNVTLNAKQVKVADQAKISASNVSGQTGGDVSFKNLETLEVSGKGTIEAKTEGDGKAGNVNVAASQSVLLDQGTLSVEATKGGKSGTLTVTTPILTLQNSGKILATTNSGGSTDTGSIILKDLNTLKIDNSKVSASTQTGTAGSVTITANQGSDPSIQLVNKGTVEAIAEKGGSAGNVTLTTPTLNITTGASVAVSSKDGEGTAGDIEVNANKITLDNGKITATTDKGGQASPADIILKDLNSLIATNNSQISASTSSGTAGNVKINATQGANPSVLLTGDGTLLAAKAGEGGNAGNVTLNAKQVKVADQAKISASNVSGQKDGNVSFENLETLEVSGGGTIEAKTEGDGKAGNVNVTASQSVLLDQGTLSVAATKGGKAGTLTVTTPTLTLQNLGEILATTNSGGSTDTGSIILKDLNTLKIDNSKVSASTQTGTAGSVTINANHSTDPSITLKNNSTVEAAAKEPGGQAGGVTVTAPKLVVKGAKISASNVSGLTGGDVTLQDLETLEVSEGGAIAATTQDSQAGNVNVEANQSVLLNRGTLSVEAIGSGKAGTLNITTPILTLNNESKILAKTTSGGSKESGNINLQKLNSLTADNSTISAETESGVAGSIKISADQGSHPAIALNNNSFIEAAAKSGQAGTVTITTSNLTVNNSLISSSTTTGKAGGVTAQASEAIILNGTSSRVRKIRTEDGSEKQLLGGIVAEATQEGVAGDVNVTSGRLMVQNGARISVSSPEGQAGNLTVTTGDLRMNQGTLEAETGGGNGGANINLEVGQRGLLLMRDGSLISANANGSANGGNIKIKAPFVIGLTFENSDIVANAVQGQGGKIDIDTQAILGLQFRPKRTDRSDITASSDFGVSGSVNLNTLTTDVTRGLSTPAIAFIDVSRLTANACAAGGAKATASSELRINGRGGVALNPTAPLPAQTTESDWVSLDVTPEVPTTVTFSGGNNVTLESGETYQLQATCVRSWKEQQRPTL